MQWPAVIPMSSPTSEPEQKAPMGWSSNFSPGQSFIASLKGLVESLYLPPASVTFADFQKETTESERVCMSAADSK